MGLCTCLPRKALCKHDCRHVFRIAVFRSSVMWACKVTKNVSPLSVSDAGLHTGSMGSNCATDGSLSDTNSAACSDLLETTNDWGAVNDTPVCFRLVCTDD